MATRIPDSSRNAAADAIAARLDAGTGPGYVEIREGTQPATANDAATGLLLGTVTCSDPAFAGAIAGVATANAVTGDTDADNTGVAGWFRAFDSDGLTVIDGSVTVTGGGGDMEINDENIIAGGTIDVTSWTITMPSGA